MNTSDIVEQQNMWAASWMLRVIKYGKYGTLRVTRVEVSKKGTGIWLCEGTCRVYKPWPANLKFARPVGAYTVIADWSIKQ